MCVVLNRPQAVTAVHLFTAVTGCEPNKEATTDLSEPTRNSDFISISIVTSA